MWDQAAAARERPSGSDVPVRQAGRASWAKDTNEQHRQEEIMQNPPLIDLLHVPSSIYKPWGCQGTARGVLGPCWQGWGAQPWGWGLRLVPGFGSHRLEKKGLKGLLLAARWLEAMCSPGRRGAGRSRGAPWASALGFAHGAVIYSLVYGIFSENIPGWFWMSALLAFPKIFPSGPCWGSPGRGSSWRCGV